MSGMQGVSGSGSMMKNCGMKGMHENQQKQKERIEVKQQADAVLERIPNEIAGKRFDMSV
ncbi:MAG: hypothetical protein CVU84_10245 [Firmicutes bacterium HGW-Firmicutes-1]|jgi:hypothetical protein|nr:MAG: hypothetical protein CVU84_10245 [Firmicutes bacterium HGW-Firmicutes-1]